MKFQSYLLIILPMSIFSGSCFASEETIKYFSDVINHKYLWKGFYSGINIGVGFGGFTDNRIDSAPFNNYSAAGDVLNNSYFPSGSINGVSSNQQFGFIGGGQFGYNHQLNASYLIGIEADLQWSSVSGKGNYKAFDTSVASNRNIPLETYYALGNGTTQTGMNWFSTIRGRLGYASRRDAIFFVTGGMAYSNVFSHFNNSLTLSETYVNGPSEVFGTFSSVKNSSNMKLGWTTGLGAEWMFAKNFSLKAETLYYNLGNVNYLSQPVVGIVDDVNLLGAIPKIRVQYDGIIAKFGVNYHFNLPK